MKLHGIFYSCFHMRVFGKKIGHRYGVQETRPYERGAFIERSITVSV